MQDKKSTKQNRQQELAAALRKNLGKRKAQQRSRGQQQADAEQPQFRSKPVKPQEPGERS